MNADPADPGVFAVPSLFDFFIDEMIYIFRRGVVVFFNRNSFVEIPEVDPQYVSLRAMGDCILSS